MLFWEYNFWFFKFKNQFFQARNLLENLHLYKKHFNNKISSIVSQKKVCSNNFSFIKENWYSTDNQLCLFKFIHRFFLISSYRHFCIISWRSHNYFKQILRLYKYVSIWHNITILIKNGNPQSFNSIHREWMTI